MTSQQINVVKGVILIGAIYAIYSFVNKKRKDKELLAIKLEEEKKQLELANIPDLKQDIINTDLPETSPTNEAFSSVDGNEKNEEVVDEEAVKNAELANQAKEWFKEHQFDISKLENITDIEMIQLAKKNDWKPIE